MSLFIETILLHKLHYKEVTLTSEKHSFVTSDWVDTVYNNNRSAYEQTSMKLSPGLKLPREIKAFSHRHPVRRRRK